VSKIKITTEKLSKRFNREWIFRNLSVEFIAGQTVAITGPNGSGKSTLMHLLAGIIPQTSGAIIYTDASVQVDAEDLYKKISYAAPYMDLIEEFTLGEHLDFHFKNRRCRFNKSSRELAEMMYLEKAFDKRVCDFSSGMKQRLKVALALYTDADIVFLDEPGSNLDEYAFKWYYESMRQLPVDALIFIASNNPHEYPSGSQILDIAAYK
jgi:ABC-type multidrug transport system ATPase subunit